MIRTDDANLRWLERLSKSSTFQDLDTNESL